ncbi:MAG: pilus assembly protein CpaF, partial [Streptomycetaceae bacterium]|nr:pilus assembly protein CpaF [Streptomycetaceae bacterium]
MSLRDRLAPEESAPQTQEGNLVAVYRTKLLQEIDLAEMSALAAAERRL